MTSNTHKAGFVAIIGSPNAGKSTLLNALIGEPLAISTPKAQTTRHRILGIFNTHSTQIIFSDTPGIVDPSYLLHENMHAKIEESISDADVVIYLADGDKTHIKSPQIKEKLEQLNCPFLVVINKADLLKEDEIETLRAHWNKVFPKAEVRVISALHNVHTLKLLERIKTLLPEHPPYFSKSEFTDRSSRFVVSEIIRKHIFLLYEKEVPYASQVVVERFKQKENLLKIWAEIYVERNTQKGIIIGKGGKSLTALGKAARLEVESFFEQNVFLDIKVKVAKDWRKKEGMLKKFGY